MDRPRIHKGMKPWRRRLRARVYGLLGRREEAAFWYTRTIPGMFRQDEIRLLYRTVAAEPGPGDIAEIGSWKGRTAILMAMALRDTGQRDCRIHAIDHHVGSAEHADALARYGSTFPDFERNVRAAGVEAWIEPLVMKSTEAAPVLAERGVVLRIAFIDGAHDEASVREDIRALLPCMRPGGLMIFHDCDPDGGPFPGVWKAFRAELADRAQVVDRAHSLWVTRLSPAPPA